MREFIITGFPQHGKTTLARQILELVGGKYGDTSDVVYEALAASEGCSVESLRQRPKEELRPLLVQTGNEMCDVNPTALVDALRIKGVNIIAGVRRVKEISGVTGSPVLIWINRAGGPKINDNTEPQLRDYVIESGGIIVHNNRSIGDLKHAAKMIVETHA